MISTVKKLWAISPPMVASGLAHLGALPVFLALALVDQSVVNGQLAWIKPAKFALSGAVYTLTLAWAMGYIEGHRRALRVVSWANGVGLALEVALVALQAGRGVVSHFNISTPLDQVIFGVMGGVVLVIWLTGLTVPVLLVRQRFQDPALASALRTGVIVSMLGAAMGGLMTGPNKAQGEALGRGERVERVGAHAVGVPDGGAGLPVLGWSTEGGDLRIAHFVGLHALQVIPLVALWIRRRAARRGLSGLAQRRLVRVASGAYLGLIGVLTIQALRAEPVTSPSLLTGAMAAALAVVAGTAWAVAWWRQGRESGLRAALATESVAAA